MRYFEFLRTAVPRVDTEHDWLWADVTLARIVLTPVVLHCLWPGHVRSGLRVHPDREHLIYPLGSAVILKRIKDGKQEFLHGHTNNVSCISVSKSGSYIASGQVNFMGFKVAAVVIYCISLVCQMCSNFHQTHKTAVIVFTI